MAHGCPFLSLGCYLRPCHVFTVSTVVFNVNTKEGKTMSEKAEKATRDELLTPKQVYADYGFSPQPLANWRWCGMGPTYIKQTPGRGGRIKYKRSAIEQWLAERTVQNRSAAAGPRTHA